MPPNTSDDPVISSKTQNNSSGNETNEKLNGSQELVRGKVTPYKMKINWLHVIILTYVHIAAVYGLYLVFAGTKFATILFAWFLYCFQILGITAGVHRLWSHRSYEATWQLRLILMIANTVARQLPIWGWAGIHRQHHKYTDTDADPVNAKRGFFFSHIGWLCVNKHPMVIEKKHTIDMSDLRADPIVMFQKKYFTPLTLLFCFFLPTWIPIYFWNESFTNAWHVSTILRWCMGLHATYVVNSIAHIWGMRPYDKSLSSTNNFVISAYSLGEGFHNYHHVFPWDYKTAELGKYGLNWTTAFLDFFAKIGWAYNLKTVSNEMIRKRVLRTGDGSHDLSKSKDLQEEFREYFDKHAHKEDEMIWGWYDPDIKTEDKTEAQIINKVK